MKDAAFSIREEENVYHDNILDIWGNEFNFNHEKGLAEWLKNAIDAYRRGNVSDKDQYVIFRFRDGTEDIPSVVECIDFSGMSHADIQKAFKWWGDPNAAKRGLKIKTYGGHGNGGKFYMRQLFHASHFITYRDGKLSVFGFNENKKYGFANGYEDKSMSLGEALKFAGLDEKIIPFICLKSMKEGKTGFTVVRGIQPKKIVRGKIPVSVICEKLKYHPQARRPLKSCPVSVIHNGRLIAEMLRMEEIEPLPDFEGPFVFDIPETMDIKDGPDIVHVTLSNAKYPKGKLTLKTSSIPFGRAGRKSELNCIDIVGEVGILASYNMLQIGFLRNFPQAQYIYGECTCPILEDPESDCVENDRERLVDNETTKALLQWIIQQIDAVGGKIAAKETEEKERKNLEVTDEFNQILNKWKNQFMTRLFAEVFGGPAKGQSTGGTGDEGTGGGTGEHSEDKGGQGSGGIGKGGGEGEEKKRGSALPKVLLSGQEDPEYPGIPVVFSERHFAVEQRQQDVGRGIYWINMDKPMAKKIVEMYGVKSSKWRDYLFQRYVDIFMKETIYRLAKKEGGLLRPEQVDTEIMRISSLVYDKASVDLEKFLLKEHMTANDENGESN